MCKFDSEKINIGLLNHLSYTQQNYKKHHGTIEDFEQQSPSFLQ